MEKLYLRLKTLSHDTAQDYETNLRHLFQAHTTFYPNAKEIIHRLSLL
jgi:hypothetical protein